MEPLAGITSYHQPWARAVDLRTAARAGQTCAITYCCSHHKTTITSKVPTLLSSLGPVREYSCTEFVQSAYLVTPQHLKYENIPAQNSFTRHILSHLNIYSHKMNNEFNHRILYPGMNGIRTYTNLFIQLRSGRRLVPVDHIDNNQSVHASNTNEANTTTEQNTQTAESGTMPEQSQVNTSQNHTDSPN